MTSGPPSSAEQRRIETERLIAIVRIDGADAALEAARGLVDGGIRVLEFSLAADGALAAITGARRELEPGVVIGAGTVLDVVTAEAAIGAGASFVVSPGLDLDLVAWASRQGVLHVPGVLTPTEAAQAHRAGAPLQKLFPAARLGPGYVRDLLGPLPGLRLIPTGGIGLGNVDEFLAAGAVAVAVGGGLATPGRARAEIAERTRAMRDRIATQGDQR